MLFQLLCSAVPLALGVAAKPLESRADATETMMYAYGPNGIGGFPIVNVGGTQSTPGYPIRQECHECLLYLPGYAYINGKVLDMQNTTAQEVTCTNPRVLRPWSRRGQMAPSHSHFPAVESSDGTMLAHSNNETLLFAIPEHGDIRFLANSNDSFTTTGLGWYGKMLYLRVDGKMETLWTAQPTSEKDVYKLGWNITGTPALDLRKVAPSHP